MTALNFPDSPSNGDTYQGYTYNSTKSAWAKPDSPDPDARTAVYANIAALPTSGTAGDMAYVTATNRLYLWTGTGWYNIALINNNPTISGVSATYDLASDGTATTVTITASDPEGLPITYSIVSDTSGNTATVTQGTGASTNVFTITPSTNNAHAGTFSLTFRASDGVNIATAASSFTLQFIVTNSHYTTALITSVGTNNQVNNTFVDSSTNSHTITAAGNATQTTFSPYRHGGYSMRTTAGTSLNIPASTDNQFTGDFTIEGWVYSLGTGDKSLYVHGTYFAFNVNFGGGFNIYLNSGAPSFSPADIVPAANEWNHVALVRSGSTVSVYLNGVASATTATNSATLGYNSIAYIGGLGTNSGGSMNGYIADFRAVNGSAVYTSNFTPPTERPTAITNTSVLTCHLPYIADGSTNNKNLTASGTLSTEPFAPYDYGTYSASSHGGSMYFDGSGDRLQTPTHSSLTASGDFTVEMWIHPQQIANPAGQSPTFFAWNATNFMLYITASTGILNLYSGAVILSSTSNIKANRWTHVAVARDSGTTRLFVNGVSEDSTTSYSTNPSGRVVIGSEDPSGYEFGKGSIADVRLVNGTAVYTSDFTPPTERLTAITNTSLLLNGTDAGIIDKSQSAKTITLNGNTKSSTTQTKYLSSSMYFDGVNSTVSFDNNESLGSYAGDFTIEMWVYPTAVGSGNLSYLYFQGQSAANYSPILLGQGVGTYNFVYYATTTGTSWNIASGVSIGAGAQNTWSHIAVVREGTNLKTYIDGTLGTTTSIGTAALAAASSTYTWLASGNYGNTYYGGYMSDVRLTKGLARYTSNFTAPTAALQG